MHFPKGTPIGVQDSTGTEIRVGDRVRYKLDGPSTSPDYHNPEYVVVYDPPAFTLRWVGGGEDSGSHEFRLRYGGANGDLTIIKPAVTLDSGYCVRPDPLSDEALFAETLDEAKRAMENYLLDGCSNLQLYSCVEVPFDVETAVTVTISASLTGE